MAALPSINLQNEKPQTLILLGVLFVLVLVAYIYFLVFPLIASLTDTFAASGKLGNDLRTATDDIRRIGELQRSLDTYRDKVDQYERRLPAEQEIPKLLEDLSVMAKQANVKIIGITPIVAAQQPKTATQRQRNQIYQEIPILINARSGYHELGYFLSRLENADRFIKVGDIEIKSNRTSPRKHDVELVVYTYILLGEK